MVKEDDVIYIIRAKDDVSQGFDAHENEGMYGSYYIGDMGIVTAVDAYDINIISVDFFNNEEIEDEYDRHDRHDFLVHIDEIATPTELEVMQSGLGEILWN